MRFIFNEHFNMLWSTQFIFQVAAQVELRIH
jgi:hypothetical protein